MEQVTSHQGRVLSGFRRLFPKFSETVTSRPLKTELVVAMCNVVNYAFDAYEDPNITGFIDHTTSNQQVQYLDYECLEMAMDGVLKIRLHKASRVQDSDYGWSNMSDPYVVFTTGSSCVKSETINDTATPVWNSTHYLIVRKQHLKTNFDGKVHVAMFDDDTYEGYSLWTTLSNTLNQDDFLGSASLDLEELKKPGVHSLEVKLKDANGSSSHTPIVTFTVEYVRFSEICEEMDVERGSLCWKAIRKSREIAAPLSTEPTWIEKFGSTDLKPEVFINVPNTDTQVYVHVNRPAKVMTIAFRGTERSKLKDVLLDLMAYRTHLGTTRDNGYIIKANDTIKDDDVYVHSGFLSGYESIREALLQVVYDVTHWAPEWDICVTGHSLGGALATLCAFEMAHRKNDKQTGPEIGVINFGAPRVGNADFAKRYNDAVVESFRVVEKDDIVHLIPPFYTHTAKELLCLPTGQVFIEGLPLEDQTPDDILSRTREMQIEKDDAGSLEDIFTTFGSDLESMADKHGRANYNGIIIAAAKKFFGSSHAEL